VSAPPSHIRAATRGDLPEIVDLLNTCDVAETGVPDTSEVDVESDWRLEGFDLSRDAWVAVAADGTLVGYAYAGDQLRTGELESDVWVHPGRAERELAPRLFGLAERRARGLAAERGYPKATLDVFCISIAHAKRDLLTARGYELVRTVYRMAVDLGAGAGESETRAAREAETARERPAAREALPGVAIRAFRSGVDEAVMHATMTEAFADHFRQSDEPFDAWTKRLVEHADFDPGLWSIAWEGDEPVAGAIAFDRGDIGWVQGLGVRRAWRRQGIGSALLARTFAAMAARGQPRIELGVDAEGAAKPLQLYEGAGMHVTFTYELYAKDLTG